MPPHPYVHLVTPGDHFSPRTGSAIPTVVHGLCAATPSGEHKPTVLVARGTYADRYTSASIVEYPLREPSPLEQRAGRYLDVALGKLALPRVAGRRGFAQALAGQSRWPSSIVLAHNAPQAIGLVDTRRHQAVLYAHNQLLRTYGLREADRALGSATAIIAVSDYLAGALTTYLPRALHDRVAVVRNGVDVDAFAGPGRPQDGVLKVVFIGRTIPDKGPDVLVDAVVRLGRPDIQLEVVGSAGFAPEAPLTPYERGLRQAAAPAGDRIRFRSFVDRYQVPEILRGADVVVVPSRWPEPFALTVLEGMAAGAAVVGSDVGGIPETLTGAGVLVPPGDVSALAAALEGLADDPARLRAEQLAGSARAAERTWARAAQDLHRVLGRQEAHP